MANITISELRPAGFDLFQDSESFLNDLTDTDSMSVLGGSENGFNDSQYAYHAIVDIAVIHHLSFIAELVGSLASNVGGNGGGGNGGGK
ncbi:hypothetical protein IQ272_12690 [Chroococcidiopsidales cyanobacterium LEGE 13417]|nr:hypothetical protein [Chroococcidiopsidales cyanobacterium LEGE 13417]